MHGPYPGELRTRVIDFVEEGGSRREAAEPRFPDFLLAMASPLKKVCGRQSGSAPTSPARADAGFGSKVFLIRPTSYLSTRRQSPLTCCGSTVGTHAASAWSAMPRWDTGRR